MILFELNSGRSVTPSAGLSASAGLFWTVDKTNRDIEGDPLHVHLVDDEDEGLVPVGVQVAALHARLLLLPDSFAL